MTPDKTESTATSNLFRNDLANLLDHRHARYQLAELIDWDSFEKNFGLLYCDVNGSPGKPIRLMVGLEYVKQIHNMSGGY